MENSNYFVDGIAGKLAIGQNPFLDNLQKELFFCFSLL